MNIYTIYEKIFGNVMALNRYMRMMYIIPELEGVTGSRILDIGCLDGHFTRYLTGRGNEVVALDLTNYGITTALPEASFVLAKGHALPFKEDSFDFIFCSDVFEHIDDFEDIIPEIGRVLKPDKDCLISTVDGYWKSPLRIRDFFHRNLPGNWQKTLMGTFVMSDADMHRNFMGHVRYDITTDMLERLFKDSNLQTVKKKEYCNAIGSLLMEIFFAFNEKIRYFTFPFLKLALPLDNWMGFGKSWQYYFIFRKTGTP